MQDISFWRKNLWAKRCSRYFLLRLVVTVFLFSLGKFLRIEF